MPKQVSMIVFVLHQMTLDNSAFNLINVRVCAHSIVYVNIHVRGLDFFIPHVEPQIMLHLRYGMKNLKDNAVCV